MTTVLVTGAAGFIGSNFVHHMLEKYSDVKILALDLLTYAGNIENLDRWQGNLRFEFIKGDIRNAELTEKIMAKADWVVHFAAESHVDRSILDASDFISTNVYGTYCLLEAAKKSKIKRLINISSDEVYGSVETGSSTEESPLNPTSPYAASKAGADMIAQAYFATFGIPVITTRSSNNFGPYQYPEKLIPLFITNAIENKNLPLYGDGKNVRDWLYVKDNCEAIDFILQKGEGGEVYNIGGGNEKENVEITMKILQILGKPEDLIKYVEDRPGHDRRYSLDSSKLAAFGWKPSKSFNEAMEETVNWYIKNKNWWRKIKEKREEYKRFMNEYYASRR